MKFFLFLLTGVFSIRINIIPELDLTKFRDNQFRPNNFTDFTNFETFMLNLKLNRFQIKEVNFFNSSYFMLLI
jgi:hypothetical protein